MRLVLNKLSAKNKSSSNDIDESLALLCEARMYNPQSFLGPTVDGDCLVYRVLDCGAASIEIDTRIGREKMVRLNDSPVFEWRGASGDLGAHPLLLACSKSNNQCTHYYEPYSFSPTVTTEEIESFSAGRNWHAYRFLGAHSMMIDDFFGVRFAVWAPNAERVSVVGDFNGWDGRAAPLQNRGESGIWELFIPGVLEGAVYKYEIRSRHGGEISQKTDPYGQEFEYRPRTASRVAAVAALEEATLKEVAPERTLENTLWSDQAWMNARQTWDWLHSPLSVYEVHLGSWRHAADGGFLNYREIAHQLVPYVKDLGFTHIELMPISEYPYDASWGYQVTGYFAPTSRFGSPTDFKYFINYCHQHGIGVFLDWVPAHFPKDDHALARFDGSALYEHADPQLGEHSDWGTLIFNYGRNEVKSFLLSSAFYWLDEYHIDGLRVDAVASMLYLDYSRNEGEWRANRYGGNENLEAVDFLRELNCIIHEHHPGALTMAEESTSWPMVSRPTWLGGLGFSLKWNMGWMNDTLAYIENDPVHRQYHHDKLTFGLLYAFSENFILPFSHDEVVHGKGSMLDKMPGDDWQRFANLRLLYVYQFTHPGRKLLFMGDEFAQGREWNHDEELDWQLLTFPYQQGVKQLVSDLNHFYCESPALYHYDFDAEGFQWLDCHDSTQSVLSFLRCTAEESLVVVLNFTPVVRQAYRLGVPGPGSYGEVINSDSLYYQGSNVSNGVDVNAEPVEAMGQAWSILLNLPPLGGLILRRKL